MFGIDGIRSAYDNYVWLPTILSLVGSFGATYIDNFLLQILCRMVVPLIGGTVAFYLRDSANCKSKNEETNDLILKSCSNAIIAQGFTYLTITLLYFIPVIGTIFKIITMIPLMESIILGVLYLTMYMLINIFNYIGGSSYCNVSSTARSRTPFTIIALVFCLITEIKNQFF